MVAPTHPLATDIAATIEERWLSPGDALAHIINAVGDYTVAVDTVIARLTAGLIRASYQAHKWQNTVSPPRLNGNFIEEKYWKHYERSVQSAHVWKSGDLHLYLGSALGHRLSENNVALTFFGVKIERQGIEEIIANAPKPKRIKWTKKPDPPPSPEPAEEEQKGPPVSINQLRAWYAVYKQAFQGDCDTEPNAIKSAKGMFHNKSVTRAMIRGLRGKLTPGRKSRTDETAD